MSILDPIIPILGPIGPVLAASETIVIGLVLLGFVSLGLHFAKKTALWKRRKHRRTVLEINDILSLESLPRGKVEHPLPGHNGHLPWCASLLFLCHCRLDCVHKLRNARDRHLGEHDLE